MHQSIGNCLCRVDNSTWEDGLGAREKRKLSESADVDENQPQCAASGGSLLPFLPGAYQPL